MKRNNDIEVAETVMQEAGHFPPASIVPAGGPQECEEPEESQVNYTVVFDGDCAVCQRFVNVLRRWDRGAFLEIVPSQRPGVKDRFHWIAPEVFDSSIQLIGTDGTTWSGAAALEKLLDILPRGRWLGWIFRIPLVRPLAERVYRSFAGNRHRMACRTK